VMVHHSLMQPALERFASLRTPPLLNARNVPELSPPASPPRELADSELTELISNSSDDLRLVVLALLAGMSPAEIVGLHWSDIDFKSATIKVGGESPRSLPLQESLATMLRNSHAMPDDAAVSVLSDDKGNPLTREELDRIVLFAAYDAGLEHPQEITTAALRYTYLIYLLRQGIRANDISRIAGHIPQEDIVSYIQQISPGARRELGEIDRIHPALRSLPHDA